MERQKKSPKSPAQWRAHCQRNAKRFAPLGTNAADRRTLERRESECIEQLLRADLSATARAVAFRCLVDMRECTARDAAAFFPVEPAVIAEALSLLAVPRPPASHLAPPHKKPPLKKPTARKSRNHVA